MENHGRQVQDPELRPVDDAFVEEELPQQEPTAVVIQRLSKTIDEYAAREKTAVGDLNSKEKGSGARKNEGKPRLDLIPLRLWAFVWKEDIEKLPAQVGEAIGHLVYFQEGNDQEIFEAVSCLPSVTQDAARVLEYGLIKYTAWNWAKGMPWSVCFGSAMRHLESILKNGIDSVDVESGQKHIGHFLCNLLFLAHYTNVYRAGDDRPDPDFMRNIDE